jgi:hypothetical protein
MKDADMPKSIRKGKKATPKAAEADVAKMVKKAVKASTAELTARAEKAEADLAEISKTVVPGGPRPMGYPQSPAAEAKAELQARVLKYKRMANDAQDNSLAQGYEDLAKKVEVQISKMV